MGNSRCYTMLYMIRVVLDTNVLINADRGEGSYPKRILNLVRQGELIAITTDPVRRENQVSVEKLVKDAVLKRQLYDYLEQTKDAAPAPVSIELEDDEDTKLLEAAVGGRAQFLVTDDRHLLEVGEYAGVRIIRPQAFWRFWQTQQDDQGTTWEKWIGGLFGKR